MRRRWKQYVPLLVPWLGFSIACGSGETGGRERQQPAVADVPGDTGLHYADVTARAGIDFVHSIGDAELSNLVESTGGGAAFLDFDQDGNLDLYVVSGTFVEGLSDAAGPRTRPTNRLFRNRGDGTFEDVTRHARVGDAGYGMGVAVGDYDNDGYPDLYVTNYGRNVLYHNDRDGTFSDVTGRAGVGNDGCSVGAVWFDYDNDGLLDLYVGNYIQFDPEYRLFYAPDGFPGPLAYPGQADALYRNLGGGAFEDVTEQVGVLRPDGRAMGIGAADYDGDGYVDLFVANDAMENYLFHNVGGERFEEVGIPAGVAFNHRGDATSSMTVSFADYDGDGLLDMFVPDMSYGALYKSEGAGVFSDVTYPSGIAVVSGQFVGWAAAFVDYDGDGDRDVFQVNGDDHHLYGQEDLLFENQGDGSFVDVSTQRGSYFRRELVGRGGAFGDYDNDGDIDVFIVNLNDRAVLLRNEGGNRNAWLMVRLVGRRSNRDAVGARVTVVAGDLTLVAQRTSASSYLSQNDHRLHFGLGDREKVDSIEIVWPSGVTQVLRDVDARKVMTVEEPERR
ncbi:MAG: CRTAC1 family protein [Gemmatimonadales bacterium]